MIENVEPVNEYREDDDDWEKLTGDHRDIIKDTSIRMESWPDFGTRENRKETAEVRFAIDAEGIGSLGMAHLTRLISKGRLPKGWAEEIKEIARGKGWFLLTYTTLEFDFTKKRESDTSGGVHPVGHLRVNATVARQKPVTDTA